MKDLTNQICIIQDYGHIHHGKKVRVIGYAHVEIEHERYWDITCVDGSGGGMVRESALKPTKP